MQSQEAGNQSLTDPRTQTTMKVRIFRRCSCWCKDKGWKANDKRTREEDAQSH